MKGTVMTVVAGIVTVASAGNIETCTFPVPQKLIKKGARMDSVSCGLSASCCHGLKDAEQMERVVKGGGKPAGGKGRAIGDLVGTCGRADQVELYNCVVETLPKVVPAGKGGKARAKIQAKGCGARILLANAAGTDGSGQCSISKGKGKGTVKVGGVSTGCCEAVNNLKTAAQDIVTTQIQRPHGFSVRMEIKQPAFHNAQCGMIGACGKEDQKSFLRTAKGMMKGKGKGKGGGPHPAELELLEMLNMTNVAPQEMLATILTSGAEDEGIEDESDVTEDDASEDSSPIVTGLVGFVAGAAITGLGVAVLRRGTPSSEDQYDEIVA